MEDYSMSSDDSEWMDISEDELASESEDEDKESTDDEGVTSVPASDDEFSSDSESIQHIASGSGFNTVNEDVLHKIFLFAGKCYGVVGLLDKRCNSIFTLYKIPKKTFIHGYGPLSMVLSKFQHEYLGNYKCLGIGVVDYGRDDIFNHYLKLKDVHHLGYICKRAARAGRIDLLDTVITSFNEEQLERFKGYDHMSGAARGGKIETMRWLRAKKFPFDDDVSRNATKSGQLDVLKWLTEECEFHPYDHYKAYDIAAEMGRLDIIEWLVEEEEKIYDSNELERNKSVCGHAAKGGHLEILKWLRAKGAICNDHTFYLAAEGGHWDVLLWLREIGCPWDDEVCECAALSGHWDVLKWAYGEGLSLRSSIFAYAAEQGNWDMIFWLHKEDCDICDYALCEAYSKGYYGIVKWLRDNGGEELYIDCDDEEKYSNEALFPQLCPYKSYKCPYLDSYTCYDSDSEYSPKPSADPREKETCYDSDCDDCEEYRKKEKAHEDNAEAELERVGTSTYQMIYRLHNNEAVCECMMCVNYRNIEGIDEEKVAVKKSQCCEELFEDKKQPKITDFLKRK